MINEPTAEVLARVAYSGMLATALVGKEERDWKRPKNAGPTWSSRINFEEYERRNPRTKPNTVVRFPDVEEETRKERVGEATANSAREKTAARIKDPYNP